MTDGDIHTTQASRSTHYTSHITHHKSHITHDTSHITHLLLICTPRNAAAEIHHDVLAEICAPHTLPLKSAQQPQRQVRGDCTFRPRQPAPRVAQRNTHAAGTCGACMYFIQEATTLRQRRLRQPQHLSHGALHVELRVRLERD